MLGTFIIAETYTGLPDVGCARAVAAAGPKATTVREEPASGIPVYVSAMLNP